MVYVGLPGTASGIAVDISGHGQTVRVFAHVGRYFHRTMVASEEDAVSEVSGGTTNFVAATGYIPAWESFMATMTSKWAMASLVTAGPMNWVLQKVTLGKLSKSYIAGQPTRRSWDR